MSAWTDLPEDIRDEVAQGRGYAFSAESRPQCSYFRGTGICSFGCWEEPSCITDQPSEGWEDYAARIWLDNADIFRAMARERVGSHKQVSLLRGLARQAERRGVRLLSLGSPS